MSGKAGPFPLPRRRHLAAIAAAVLAASLLSASPGPAYAAGLPIVADYEGDLPITTSSPGIFPFGNDAASTPALSQATAADRPGAGMDNHALKVVYTTTAYGGHSHNLTAAQDWTAYGGFSFWAKGSGSGRQIQVEVKDGGADGEHSELWESHFTDTADWQQVKIPFGSFTKRTDYQPGGGPTDGTLTLTNMWGYAVNLGSNVTGELLLDDIALYGSAQPRVGLVQDAYTTDAGGSVDVTVTATQPGDGPLSNAITVHYTVGGGTAVDGTDFHAATGTLTFPAGTASGTTQHVTVATIGGTPAAVGKTIPVKLTAEGATLGADTATVVINAHGLPYLDASLPTAQRVSDLLSRMSLAEKVGQMTQAERAAVGSGTPIITYRLGSLLSGGGSVPNPNTPTAWADMIDNFQLHARATPLQIPLIYGIDAVHGDNNLDGATVFPHNIGLGASRDPDLVKQTGELTAQETRATGIPWTFSPCLCVTRDERWGRSYESFGEDPALVQLLETIIDGLQHDGNLADRGAVLATAKHFFGDGGTRYGSSTNGSYTTDQGVTYGTRDQIEAIHLAPFKTAVRKGVGSVMPSYSSLQILGEDNAPVKMHGRADQITGVLKQQLGFKGFVISDWAGIDQLGPDYKNDVKIGVNAGIDMVMVPFNVQGFTTALTELATSGDVTSARIDDAVTRILTQKFALGLFEHPFADRTGLTEIGSAAHRQVARQAAAKSQVLLKNDDRVLPLAKTAKIYVAGSNADDLGNQAGGWTLSWQGGSGNAGTGTTILAGIRQVAPHATITYSKDASAPIGGASVGVVVVGETPYAEGIGDVGNGHTLQLSLADRAAVEKVCAAVRCVVVTVSGRPLDLTGVVPRAAGVVASWLPGSEGAGVADVLFGDKPFTGRLPVSWFLSESQLPLNLGDRYYDPLYAYGWGLRTDSGRARLQSLRTKLAVLGDDRDAAAAVRSLDRALTPGYWRADGTARDGERVLAALQDAARSLQRSTHDGYGYDDPLVSVARDIAQAAVVEAGPGGMAFTASLTADAEHQLLLGNPSTAVGLLSQAYHRAS
ncbi:glycoside hydrolase family 3 N-terminal domain-containing protein [Catellatospora tritici]|uniref:glycoside hydrolase family 3 N-terminal domain-containing protein n=1 Tax=Catellatospora tritici TaxID=2851566 RepID=UPI001C2CF5CD|nr:glycoside hydrolase family 3 N-terminal domain-containing protein [Catellatospora tritici]MBV1853905.1 glycoside hydrolase family 3 C-terminal domain-containing protein [Catellatospora tritici]